MRLILYVLIGGAVGFLVGNFIDYQSMSEIGGRRRHFCGVGANNGVLLLTSVGVLFGAYLGVVRWSRRADA